MILYRELYFRHIYSRLQPTLEQRFESYENYCDLFNYVLDSDAPVPLELPTQWLWDIIDEFIYQVGWTRGSCTPFLASQVAPVTCPPPLFRWLGGVILRYRPEWPEHPLSSESVVSGPPEDSFDTN